MHLANFSFTERLLRSCGLVLYSDLLKILIFALSEIDL